MSHVLNRITRALADANRCAKAAEIAECQGEFRDAAIHAIRVKFALKRANRAMESARPGRETFAALPIVAEISALAESAQHSADVALLETMGAKA